MTPVSAVPRILATLLTVVLLIGCSGTGRGTKEDWSKIDYTAHQDNDASYTAPASTGFCGLMHDFRCE